MAKQAKQQTKAAARIVADITRVRDGKRVFWVTSQSQPGKLWRVAVERARLSCGCPASVYTGNCAHRKLAHAVLEAEYAERKATRDVVTISVPAPTGFGAKSAPRESLLNRNQAFSMLKV